MKSVPFLKKACRSGLSVGVRSMRVKWLFALWAVLLVAVGLLLTTLISVSDRLFYAAEALIVCCLFFLHYFYRRTVKPLDTIGNAMDLLREQDFSSRLAPVGQREADRIVQLFNRLMDQLKNERLRVREQNHFLDLLVSASPMGVVLLDFDRRLTSVNAAARNFLGLPIDAPVEGCRLSELDSPLAVRLSALAPGEVATVRLNDAMIYRCSSLSFVDRGLSHPFLLVERLTSEIWKAERKTYEKAIRMIAHEVNNSVGGLTSALDCLGGLIAPYDEGGEIGSVVEVCSERCTAMNRFIGRLAELVRIPEPQLRPEALGRRVTACRVLLEHICRDRGVVLQGPFVNGVDPVVQLDAVLFEQALLNIVKNAAESAATGGGLVAVHVVPTDGGGGRLEVADNGPGIRPEDEPRLFTPFFTTKPEGQGIGLLLVREVLTRQGCTFSLKTDADGWTRFRIRFPKA